MTDDEFDQLINKIADYEFQSIPDAITEDEFDELIDNASDKAFNLIPDKVIDALDDEGRSYLLVRINDALSPILRSVIACCGTDDDA